MDRRTLECVQSAIAVMTAALAEEGKAKTLAVDVANDYLKEPDGNTRLVNGFMQLSVYLLQDIEKYASIPPQETLRALGEATSAWLESGHNLDDDGG